MNGAKKKPSRLRAIFASLRERGNLRRSQKEQAKTIKLADRFYKSYKKSDHGLSNLNRDERERVIKHIKLMNDLGMLAPKTREEIAERSRRGIYASELEKHLRTQLEAEYERKYAWKRHLHDAIIAGMTGLPPIPSMSSYPDVSLENIPQEKLEKAGTGFMKAAKPTAEQKLTSIWRQHERGDISQSVAQTRMQNIEKKLRELKEKRRLAKKFNRATYSADAEELKQENEDKGLKKKKKREASTEDVFR